MNRLDKQYQELLQDILDNGVTKADRTGTGTKSVFGRAIGHRMSDGFPLLTTKKMAWKQIVVELIWFLRGDTNIKFLVDNNCHIWDGDAYKNYEKAMIKSHAENGLEGNSYLDKESFIERIKTDENFAKKWGNLGPIYGKQWRNWEYIESYDYMPGDQYPGTEKFDQMQRLINDLNKNPDSRRLMVNAWNVGEIDKAVLPPCHYGFQCWTRELSEEEREKIAIEKYPQINDHPSNALMDSRPFSHEFGDTLNIPKRALSLMWNQRSVDTFLGLPFNIASYGLLLEILSRLVNMVPENLIGVLGDTHLYLNHLDKAKEQIGRAYSDEELREMHPILKEAYDKKCEYVKKQDYEIASQYRSQERDILATLQLETRQPYPLPTISIDSSKWDFNIDNIKIEDFKLNNYVSHPAIKADLSN